MKTLRSIVNGKQIRTSFSQPVINPFTRTEIASMELLFDAPNTNPKPSHYLNPEEIKRVFQRFTSLLLKKAKELATLASEETGSPIKYHLEDIEAVIRFCQNIEFYQRRSQLQLYNLVPKGDILILLSANEPVILSSLTTISALISGNRVYLKPSSKTPSTPEMIVKLLLKAGIPPELLNLLLLSQTATQKLLSSGKLDLVLSFSSSKVNDTLARITHPRTQFIPENEGNDWVYIDRDFSFTTSQLAAILTHSFTKHNGQMCDATRGILVHESQYQSICKQLQERISQLVIADPRNTKSDLGSLLFGTEKQLPTSKTNTAIPKLIEFAYIGENLVSEPLFAPIVWIKSVKNAQEALNFYNDYNVHGLSFSIFSIHTSCIDFFSEQIQAARININVNPVNVDIFSPWGGIKKSGLNGAATWIEYFSNRKIINYGKFGH